MHNNYLNLVFYVKLQIPTTHFPHTIILRDVYYKVLPYKIVANDAKVFLKLLRVLLVNGSRVHSYVTMQQFAAAYSTRSVCMQGGCDTKSDFVFFYLHS